MDKKELTEAIIKQVASKATTIEEARWMLKDFIWPVIENMMQAEMDDHLWYKKHTKKGYNTGNSRNWNYKKQVISTDWEIDINVPRDRNWEYNPQVTYSNK